MTAGAHHSLKSPGTSPSPAGAQALPAQEGLTTTVPARWWKSGPEGRPPWLVCVHAGLLCLLLQATWMVSEKHSAKDVSDSCSLWEVVTQSPSRHGWEAEGSAWPSSWDGPLNTHSS